jgi:hypothetical protein
VRTLRLAIDQRRVFCNQRLDVFCGLANHVRLRPRLDARSHRHACVNQILHRKRAGGDPLIFNRAHQSGEPGTNLSIVCGSLRRFRLLLRLLFPEYLNIRLVVSVDQGIEFFDTRCDIRSLWAGL